VVGRANLPACERLSVWFGGHARCTLDDVYPPADSPYRDEDDGGDDEEFDNQFSRYPATYSVRDLDAMEVHGVEGRDTLRLVKTLLAGRFPPELRELGLQSTALEPDVIDALAHAPILKKIARLDLSGSSIAEQGALALRDAAPALRGLESIDLRRVHIPARFRVRVMEALPNARFDEAGQMKQQQHPDFFFRYVATVE
jgi:hypothetical protein